jgi:hypothetical protein
MAIIHKSTNNLEVELGKRRKKIEKVWIGSLFVSIIFLFLGNGGMIGSIILLTLFINMVMINKNHIIKVGMKGEEKAKDLAMSLDENHHVFTNLQLEYEGKTSETDIIVVGHSGLFIIEIKNHNGTIVGTGGEKFWTQHKVGRKGGEYSKQLYSPEKQVKTHVYRLSKILKDNHIHTWVQGMVYFINSEVRINITATEVPVTSINFNGNLRAWLEENKSKQSLSNDEIKKIVEVLKEYTTIKKVS